MEPMDRRTFLRASLFAAGTVALASCGSSSKTTSTPGGSAGGPVARPTLRLAGGDFGFPSPFAYSRGPGYWRMTYLYDSLLWKDSNGQLIPWLASGYDRSSDGLTYSFELRDNVAWNDGKPLTPDDVVFTFEYFAAQKLSPQIFVRPQDVAGVQATGPRTVEIRLTRPVATFLNSVAGALPIVPRHVWSSVDDASKAQDPKLLVGTGPYRLESYSRGEGSYLYTANDTYFLGAPFVKRIEMRPVQQRDELTPLLAGEIDAGGPSGTGATRDALAPFKADPAFGIVEGPGDFTIALYWNLAMGGALGDVRFRQACVRAINRPDLVARLVGGNGKPGNPGFLPTTNPAHAPVEQYAFDVGAANRQLDDAGYTRSGGGTRQGPDGKPLRFSLVVGNSPVPPATDIVVNALKAIGVELIPQPLDQPTRDARTVKGDYEMALSEFGGLGGDADYLRQVYSSKVPKRFQSASGFANPEFDDFADRQLVTLDDGERRKLLAGMQEIVADQVPLLPLYYPASFLAYRKAVFDQWYYTPGGFGGGVPTVYNKQVFVTGQKAGTEIRPTR